MAGRATLSRRSAAEWGIRAILAVGAAYVGYGSATQSLAYAIRAGATERAHALAPGDGRITALMSEMLAGPTASAADRRRADDFARRALQQDPTAVAAVATLGINAQIRGDTPGARGIFGYARFLSRRDLRTRLWALEDAVARDDVRGALRHYDIALRTSRTAPDLLFPVLAQAIGVPAVRDGLARTLAARPAWGDLFVAFAAGNAPDPQATAQLFESLRHRGIMLPASASQVLIARLIAENHVAAAWHYYAAVTPDVARQRSRDPGFAATLSDPSAFDWTPLTDNGVSATLQRSGNSGLFDFAVPPNVGGPVLRQWQVLPPGEYVLEGRSTGIEQPEATLPYWTLTCREGQELGRIVLPSSVQRAGRFDGRFTVPANCPVQQLQLIARPSDQLAGVAGQIIHLRLRPAER